MEHHFEVAAVFGGEAYVRRADVDEIVARSVQRVREQREALGRDRCQQPGLFT